MGCCVFPDTIRDALIITIGLIGYAFAECECGPRRQAFLSARSELERCAGLMNLDGSVGARALADLCLELTELRNEPGRACDDVAS